MCEVCTCHPSIVQSKDGLARNCFFVFQYSLPGQRVFTDITREMRIAVNLATQSIVQRGIVPFLTDLSADSANCCRFLKVSLYSV